VTDTSLIRQAHDRLLADPAAISRLADLKGWTRDAIEQLGLGLDGDRVVIPVAHADGTLAAILRYQPNPDKRAEQPKSIATPGAKRELFPPPETIDPAATVWLVEGEPDAVTATSVGLPAVAIPGSNGWKPDWAIRFAGRDVVICTDCDNPGRSLAARVADDLTGTARSTRIIDLSPPRDDGYDLSDFVGGGNDHHDQAREVLERLATQAPLHIPEKDRPPRPRLTIADWRKSLIDHLDGDEQEAAWPIPFTELNEAADGGIRPGEVWVIAGYTSHGKSIYADMLADSVSAAGARVHLYLTEMTIVQRGLRLLARRTGLPFRNLRRRWLTPEQIERAKQEITLMNYGATVVSEWTPQHVATDARATGTQVAIIDLLHGFHYSDERELSAYIDTFASAASSDAGGTKAGTAVILICHLNDAQMRDARSPSRPKPGMHSLKISSVIRRSTVARPLPGWLPVSTSFVTRGT